MKKYSILNEFKISFTVDTKPQKLSVASAIKPFKIGNVSFIVAAPYKLLKYKIDKKLTALIDLEKSLQDKLLKSKGKKNDTKLAAEKQTVQQAYQIHNEYFSKILYWKQQGSYKNVNQIKNLNQQYDRKMFMLKQNYMRLKVGLNQVSEIGEYINNGNNGEKEDFSSEDSIL